MGLTIHLQTEQGEREGPFIEDPKGLLTRLLPSLKEHSYHYLPYINPYGDTIFNTLQMEPFLAEWRRLNETSSDADLKALLKQVEALAVSCFDSDDLYLRFVGD